MADVTPVLGHGPEKFPASRLLESSLARGWSGLFAERRAHTASTLPSFTPPFTEVSVLIRGVATVTRQAAGMYQQTVADPGTIWLSPAGVKEDFTVISTDIAEAVHLYLPARPFEVLARATENPAIKRAELLYWSGFRDPFIEQIAEVVVGEMRSETFSARILVESIAQSLTARLLHRYSSLSPARPSARVKRPQLDRRRLQRVLNFIEANIESDITVADLAAAAHLSEFHFSRAFKATTNRSPYRYLSDRRLSHAKWLPAETDRPLIDIAQACRFSSLGNLSRAFQRATGTTPGRFRRARKSALAAI